MHRDIKPPKQYETSSAHVLLISPDRVCPVFISYLDSQRRSFHGGLVVKLGDFGCAKQLDDDTSISDAGTIRYKAPVSLGYC
jgi:serine/threonine protein kinase